MEGKVSQVSEENDDEESMDSRRFYDGQDENLG